MNKPKLAFLIFYTLNLLGVFLLVILLPENPFRNMLLAMYLILLTGIFIYANRKKQ